MKYSDIQYIIVHCSDSPHRGDTAEDIHLWHLQRGWDGIGYHSVIREDGTLDHGRPLYWMGSHARGYNDKSWGICLLGDTEFTEAQIAKLKDTVNALLQLAPNAMVVGHCDLDSRKTCPNFNVIEMFSSE
jgi:N-acetylmuramoyl-L-alanine amidase